MELKDLRSGNLIYTRNSDYSEKAKKGWDLSEIIQINIYGGGYCNLGKDIGKRYNDIDEHCYFSDKCELKPIELTEELLLKCGYSVINENSAGKRYGYVINGIFSSDLTFTFWKTTKESSKFFRGNLELKYLHQLQNLYFALTQTELQITL